MQIGYNMEKIKRPRAEYLLQLDYPVEPKAPSPTIQTKLVVGLLMLTVGDQPTDGARCMGRVRAKACTSSRSAESSNDSFSNYKDDMLFATVCQPVSNWETPTEKTETIVKVKHIKNILFTPYFYWTAFFFFF